MSVQNYLLISLLGVISVFSCQNENYIDQMKPVSFNDVLLTLSEIEYAFYLEDGAYANSVLGDLIDQIESCDHLVCASSKYDLLEVITDIEYLETYSSSSKTDHLLDKLRIIKAKVMSLDTSDDYDPYIYMMWRFEEDMYYVTKAAIDPMLDLYEWEEFVDMKQCMNEKWSMLMQHYPSSETLDGDKSHYRNQISKKIRLDQSMKELDYIVYRYDASDDSLCEVGESLRKAYVNYLRSFLMVEDSTSIYLANL